MQCPTNVSAKPNTILTDTQVSFVSNPDTNTSTQYPYRATVSHNDIQANMTATVVFSNAQATSGNYAPFCQTFDGGLYIYAKVNTTITIPTIRIDGVLNYYNLNGTVGSDAQPIKIVNGQATPIAYELGKYGIFQHIGNFLYLDSSTVPFGWISVNGILNYVRTGPKCGFISFACKLETGFTGDTSQQQSAYNNFIGSFFKVGEVSVFGQKLGVSFKTTGFETYSGRWWGHKNSTGVLSSEYGNFVCWHGPSDTIYLGRMYENGGLQYGGWPFSALAGDSVIAMDIYVEEN